LLISDNTSREAKANRGEEEEEQFKDPDDESNLFAGTVYEADDAEADAIWDSVEQHMEGRRKARREIIEAEELAKERATNVKLDVKFADLKRGLSDVTDNEWENLPEVGDLTRRRRKANLRMQENGNGKSYAVSDTILAGAMSQNATVNELDEKQMSGEGFDTPATMQGTETDLVGIGQARDRVLSLQLDQASKDASASGLSSTVDPRGYMTALNSQVLQSDAQIGLVTIVESLRGVSSLKFIIHTTVTSSELDSYWTRSLRVTQNMLLVGSRLHRWKVSR